MHPKHRSFANLHPHAPHSVLDVLRWKLGRGPREVVTLPDDPVLGFRPERREPDLAALQRPDPDRVQVTWIGHSTFLIQHQGRNILTDPIFSEHCSPFPLRGLRRVTPPGIPFASLPPIHGVAISHSHYDHLDRPTIRRLGTGPAYWVPTGLAAWFRRQGIPGAVELDWWQGTSLAWDFEIFSVPAQHFSARSPFDRNRTHWCGWVFRSRARNIYFGGDTGYCPVFAEIGARLGPFDLAMIPIGAYNPRSVMQTIHVNPAEAVRIHLEVRSRQSVACHWGTFRLTDEPLGEPPALLRQHLAEQQIEPDRFRALAFGETLVI